MPIMIPRFDKPKRLKYGNTIVEVDGIKFDSAGEARRYGDLQLMEKAEEIRHLEVHRIFNLKVNGIEVCDYEADFYYLDLKTHRWVVEDYKSKPSKDKKKKFSTANLRVYKIKKKLMLAVYGITIREV